MYLLINYLLIKVEFSSVKFVFNYILYLTLNTKNYFTLSIIINKKQPSFLELLHSLMLVQEEMKMLGQYLKMNMYKKF